MEPLVVKFLNENFVRNRNYKRYNRFKKEVKICKELSKSTKSILPIRDCNLPKNLSITDRPWFIMPKAETLADIKMYSLPFMEKIELMRDIAILIRELHTHEKKYAHRDIKPENILFYNKQLIWSDFGLAYDSSATKRLTGKKENIGPWNTIAPEMKRDPHNIIGYDFLPADIYSFGKTLWIILTGKVDCFDGEYTREKRCCLKLEEYNVESIEIIHQILELSTKDFYVERPTIDELLKLIDMWFYVIKDPQLLLQEKISITNKKVKETKNPNIRVYEVLNDIKDILNYYRELCYIESKEFGIIEVANTLNSEKKDFLELVNNANKSYIIKPEKLEIIDDKLPILYTSFFDFVDFDNEKYEDPQKVFVPILGDKKITLRNQDKFEFKIRMNQ